MLPFLNNAFLKKKTKKTSGQVWARKYLEKRKLGICQSVITRLVKLTELENTVSLGIGIVRPAYMTVPFRKSLQSSNRSLGIVWKRHQKACGRDRCLTGIQNVASIGNLG